MRARNASRSVTGRSAAWITKLGGKTNQHTLGGATGSSRRTIKTRNPWLCRCVLVGTSSQSRSSKPDAEMACSFAIVIYCAATTSMFQLATSMGSPCDSMHVIWLCHASMRMGRPWVLATMFLPFQQHSTAKCKRVAHSY